MSADKEALIRYRIRQAEESLKEAQVLKLKIWSVWLGKDNNQAANPPISEKYLRLERRPLWPGSI